MLVFVFVYVMLNSAAGTMSNSMSYGNDRSAASTSSLEPEYGIDPASGGFFHADSKKYKRKSYNFQ